MTCNENYFNDFFPLLTRHLYICSLQQLYKLSPYVQRKRSSDLHSHGKCKVVKISTKIFFWKIKLKWLFWLWRNINMEKNSILLLRFLEFWVRLGLNLFFSVHIKTICLNIRLPIYTYNFHLLFFHLSNAYFLKGSKDSWKSIDDNRQ